MAWFGGIVERKIERKVSGDVSIDGEAFEAGTIFIGELQGGLGGVECSLEVITTSGKALFLFENDSSITATNNSITFSEMYSGLSISETVHLKGAEQSQIQRFLDELPTSIKGKVKRRQSEVDDLQRQLSGKGRKSKANTKRRQSEDNLQRQLSEMQQREEILQRQSREVRQREENLQRQMTEMQQREENLQRQLSEMQQREENSQRQMSEMRQRDENLQRQMSEMQQREENSQRQMGEMQQREENSQRQMTEMQQREENLQRQLREVRQREENSQRQLGEMREGEENSQRQMREMRQREENSQRQMRDMVQREENSQRQMTLKDRQVNELQLSLSTAQQTVSELRRQETCDWVIARDEIQMTDRCLGRGGWGSVYEGKYCGCTVAVKQIHDLILSRHNIRLFEREMNIASKCRHPSLLQFIGATNDEGSPLFVTELMETSLRALLERRELSETEIFTVSRDVAQALNYLHQKKPEPIIHRDVSSANVLLWRQGDQWRGKVSDYGTANFMQNTMTVAPGAMIYSAPEALTSNQTVKIDVYSFGVLLCEMCIGELPDPRRRDEQVVLVSNHVFRDLVRRCLQENPEMRPNIQQILDELEEFNTTS